MSEVQVPVCGRCKKPIVDIAFVQVNGAIVLQTIFKPEIPLYKTVEHAENYAKRINLHADCWMDTLRDHGVQLHDMTKVLAELQAKAAIDKKPQKSLKKKK